MTRWNVQCAVGRGTNASLTHAMVYKGIIMRNASTLLAVLGLASGVVLGVIASRKDGSSIIAPASCANQPVDAQRASDEKAIHDLEIEEAVQWEVQLSTKTTNPAWEVANRRWHLVQKELEVRRALLGK